MTVFPKKAKDVPLLINQLGGSVNESRVTLLQIASFNGMLGQAMSVDLEKAGLSAGELSHLPNAQFVYGLVQTTLVENIVPIQKRDGSQTIESSPNEGGHLLGDPGLQFISRSQHETNQ